jgi:hypothetical protein
MLVASVVNRDPGKGMVVMTNDELQEFVNTTVGLVETVFGKQLPGTAKKAISNE